MKQGIIKSISTDTDINSSFKVRIAEVEVAEGTEVDVELRSDLGDHYPEIGSLVIFDEITQDYRVSSKIPELSEPYSKLNAGDRAIGSVSSGSFSAVAHFTKSGDIIFNEGDDYAVKYNKLKKAFDALKKDLNNFINLFNAHVHAGIGATTAPPAIPSSADMSNAQVDKVKL